MQSSFALAKSHLNSGPNLALSAFTAESLARRSVSQASADSNANANADATKRRLSIAGADAYLCARGRTGRIASNLCVGASVLQRHSHHRRHRVEFISRLASSMLAKTFAQASSRPVAETHCKGAHRFESSGGSDSRQCNALLVVAVAQSSFAKAWPKMEAHLSELNLIVASSP